MRKRSFNLTERQPLDRRNKHRRAPELNQELRHLIEVDLVGLGLAQVGLASVRVLSALLELEQIHHANPSAGSRLHEARDLLRVRSDAVLHFHCLPSVRPR